MKLRLLAISLILFALASCSQFQKVQKSSSIVEKYDAAVKYYISGDYYRAGLLFEELIPLMRGKKEAENTEFYYSYCQYYQRQLVLSAYYFKKFVCRRSLLYALSLALRILPSRSSGSRDK